MNGVEGERQLHGRELVDEGQSEAEGKEGGRKGGRTIQRGQFDAGQ